MAARTKPLHPAKVEEMRKKIRATLLIKRLEDYALTDSESGKEMMNDGQVRAALGLLKKIVPDVATVELKTDPDNPPQLVQRIELVNLTK